MVRVVKTTTDTDEAQAQKQQPQQQKKQQLPVLYPSIGTIAICLRDSKTTKYGATLVMAKIVAGRVYDGKQKKKISSRELNGPVLLKFKNQMAFKKGEIIVYGANLMQNLVEVEVDTKQVGAKQ